jgi:hypothetical protein
VKTAAQLDDRAEPKEGKGDGAKTAIGGDDTTTGETRTEEEKEEKNEVEETEGEEPVE